MPQPPNQVCVLGVQLREWGHMGKSTDVAVEQGLCSVPLCKQAFTAMAPRVAASSFRGSGIAPGQGWRVIVPPAEPLSKQPALLGLG